MNISRRLLSLSFALPLIFTAVTPAQAENFDFYIMGGPAYSRLANNTNIAFNPFLTNAYHTTNLGNWAPLLGAGVGHSFNFADTSVSLNVGVSGYYTNYGSVEGTELPFINDGYYDTLHYKFHTQSMATMVEAKVFFDKFQWQPYVTAGVGCAWKRFYGYSERAAINPMSAATAQNGFAGKTTSSFAYAAGLGLQHQIFADPSHDVQYFVTVDYRYLNFGKGELGAAENQLTNVGLKIPNMYTQALVLSLKASV